MAQNIKRITVILAILSVIFLLPGISEAEHILGVKHVTPLEKPTIPEIINRIQGFLFGLLLAIASLFILYAAYLYLASGGNPEQISSAKKYIIYAVIAIVVAFLSEGIVFAVKELIGAGGGGGGGTQCYPRSFQGPLPRGGRYC